MQDKLAGPGLSAWESSPASQSGENGFFFSFFFLWWRKIIASTPQRRQQDWSLSEVLSAAKENKRPRGWQRSRRRFFPNSVRPVRRRCTVYHRRDSLSSGELPPNRRRVLQQIAAAYKKKKNPGIYQCKRNNSVGFSSSCQVHHRAAVTLLIWFTRRPPPTCAALCALPAMCLCGCGSIIHGHMHSSLWNLSIIDSAVPTVGMVSGISISVSHYRARTRARACSFKRLERGLVKTSNARKEHGALQCASLTLSLSLADSSLTGFRGKQKSVLHLSPSLTSPAPSLLFLWLHLTPFQSLIISLCLTAVPLCHQDGCGGVQQLETSQTAEKLAWSSLLFH